MLSSIFVSLKDPNVESEAGLSVVILNFEAKGIVQQISPDPTPLYTHTHPH